MNFSNSYFKLFIGFTLLTISACSDDDDVKNVVSDPTIPKSEVAMSSLVVGSGINVSINPSGIAPLTAELSFSTHASSQVEITVTGEEPISKAFNATSTTHSIPVLGLYPDTANKVVVKVTTALFYAYDTLTIVTDSLPSILPTVEINTVNEALMEPGMNLNCLSITDGTNFQPYPLVYDKHGKIRWYLNFEGVHPGFVAPMEFTSDGNLLFETGATIVEYDMLGYKKKTVPLPSGYTSHHDVIKLPNGNYTVAVDKASAQVLYNSVLTPSVEDIFIEINGTTGALVKEWDIRAILDVDREDLATITTSFGAIDWFHMNAVIYSESDDTYIVSGRNQGLIKVDQNNNLVWILAPHKGWGKAGIDGTGAETSPFLLTAVNNIGVPYDTSIQNGNQKASDFDWTWGQHAPLILPNGNLMAFDNGFNRQYAPATYSRAVEYSIDETTKTITQLWSYGESRGAETLSPIISDVDYLPTTGNIIFCPGIIYSTNPYSKIVEVNHPGGQVVFEGTLKFKNERSTGNGFGQFDLTYRAERIQLYR